MKPLRGFQTLLFSGVLAALAAKTAAAQQGSITGRVTEAATGRPIASAQIMVLGTTLGAQTNSEGAYTIRGINPGSIEVRALRIGYIDQRKTATVSAGASATIDFALAQTAVTLNPVVTTVTGEQRRVELGNAIAQVDAANLVETRPVANLGDLLTARAPGVQVLPGTQTGAGTRVRIRGTSSLSLTNNPIYVIDGVRVESSTGSISVGVGGTTTSRVGDLNPEEIENIEIVKGPSAATLYGTDAANGVIVITTKKGVAGRTKWNYYTEQTAIRDENDYPDAFRSWRKGTTAATNSLPNNSVQCFLTQVAAKACTIDSVTTFDLFKDAETTPYGTGYRYQHGLQLSGGTDALRFFLHGEYENEDGVTKVPEFDKRYLAARNLSLRPEQENPNALVKITGRANVNITLPRNADIGVSVGYTKQDVRLPMSDDSGVSGIGANVFGGLGCKYCTNAAGDTLWGWRQFTPRDIYQATTNQAIDRLIGAVNSSWRPQEWLQMRGNFGLDFANRVDTQLCRFANCPDVGTDRLGYKRDNRTNFYVFTVDAGATATRQLSTTVQSKTTAGVQFYRNVFDRNGATGLTLPSGATTVTAGAVQSADESTSESRTLGGFVEEAFAFRDRMFLTAAVRSDRNSAFGADFKTVFYPKLSGSWIMSDEDFFPRPAWLSNFRVRAAYGASGVQPGTTDAVQFFSATTARTESGDAPGLVFTTSGNRNLKPERSTEFEGGFDVGMWNNRVTAELTGYRKRSKDALISRILPPSIGTGATARFENLGQVSNYGFEALINAQILQRRSIGWDMTINASTNRNNLDSLGGVPPITSSSTIRQVQGYPLNGWWSRRLKSYEDKDKNGIITVDEIVVSDTSEFHGYSSPKHEVSWTNGFDLMSRRVRVTTQMDYKGGHLWYYNSERIRCSNRLNCQGLIDPNASLFEQARSVMLREHASRSVAGYFEPADFIRFRELAVNVTAPESFAARFLRGRSLVATAAVRNVGILWTRYSGVDPESTFGATGDSPSDFQAAAPPTYFTVRFTLGF